MSLVRFYFYRETVVMPTIAQAEAGFYLDVEPIRLVDRRNLNEVRRLIADQLAHENPVVPTPAGDEDPSSIVLETLRLTKWTDFEMQSVMFTIHRTAQKTVCYSTARGKDGMWRLEPSRERNFGNDVPISNIVDAVMFELTAEIAIQEAREHLNKGSLLPSPYSSDSEQ